MPKRVQRRRTKGWKMPDGAVYVGRPTKWGNPFQPYMEVLMPARELGLRFGDRPPLIPVAVGTLEEAIAWYLIWAKSKTRIALRNGEDWLAPLRGRDLCCWCPLGQPCHADTLLELANAKGG